MIEVTGLTRYYGGFAAVKDVGFSIQEKSIVGFLGLNGAGKSTVLKMLGGILSPTAGNISIGGTNLLEADEQFKTSIGYLPEEPPLYREMRVDDFLVWCGQLKGLSKEKAKSRLEVVIKDCQLEPMRHRVIDTLSHGYRKRVGIAQAIIHEPKLVILDEPISGLDPVQIVEMREVLRALKGSCTVLISSHILTEISQICDRILVLNDGMIVADGSEAELQSRLGGTKYRATLINVGADAVKKWANRLESIKGISVKANAKDELKVEFVLDVPEPEAFVALAVSEGAGVRSLSSGTTELEEIFVSVVENREMVAQEEE